jgi:hypothetical protein
MASASFSVPAAACGCFLAWAGYHPYPSVIQQLPLVDALKLYPKYFVAVFITLVLMFWWFDDRL